jgi:hypothetical protein
MFALLFDLEDYATTYRATRDAYLKAANGAWALRGRVLPRNLACIRTVAFFSPCYQQALI